MGNNASRQSDLVVEGDEAPSVRKGQKASKIINRITLYVVIGNTALFEVKRTQHAAIQGTPSIATGHDSTTPKSEIQVSIRQIPITGHPVAEEVMTTDDLASIKLHKARRNSIHSFSLNFDRDQNSEAKPLEVESKCGEMTKSPEKPSEFIAMDFIVDENEQGSVKVKLDYRPESVVNLAPDTATREDDTDSDCSDSPSFALQISKLAASAIESENETVEKWGEKLAKAIESKIGLPTSVVVKKSSRSKAKKKKSSKKAAPDSGSKEQLAAETLA